MAVYRVVMGDIYMGAAENKSFVRNKIIVVLVCFLWCISGMPVIAVENVTYDEFFTAPIKQMRMEFDGDKRWWPMTITSNNIIIGIYSTKASMGYDEVDDKSLFSVLCFDFQICNHHSDEQNHYPEYHENKKRRILF